MSCSVSPSGLNLTGYSLPFNDDSCPVCATCLSDLLIKVAHSESTGATAPYEAYIASVRRDTLMPADACQAGW